MKPTATSSCGRWWLLGKDGVCNMIFGTDQAPSCLALQSKDKTESDQEIILQNSPVGKSQSNGVAEKAAQDIEDQVRCLKDALGEHMNGKISKESGVLL